MKEAIILAGGFGTRLQSIINDRPKCMAIVAGKPFLEHILDYLKKKKFEHVILSLGYRSDAVIEWIRSVSYPFKISFSVEKNPLGTGGAIKFAVSKAESDTVFVLNGDTFFDVKVDEMMRFHVHHNSDITLALKPMSDFERYGSVVLDFDSKIQKFEEKKYIEVGLINGGVYLINKSIFNNTDLKDQFSFEKDILEAMINKLSIYGYTEDSYFIDIGIPEDYRKANLDFLFFDI